MEFSQAHILSVIGALCTVIGVLWGVVNTWWRREKKRLKDCEAKHEENEKTILVLTGKYKYLEGRMDGVEALSNTLLEKVNRCRDKKPRTD